MAAVYPVRYKAPEISHTILPLNTAKPSWAQRWDPVSVLSCKCLWFRRDGSWWMLLLSRACEV